MTILCVLLMNMEENYKSVGINIIHFFIKQRKKKCLHNLMNAQGHFFNVHNINQEYSCF